MASSGRRIVVEFLGKDSVSPAAKKVEQTFGRLGGRIDKVGIAAGRVLAGGLLLGGVAAIKATKAAADDEQAQAKLANTLRQAAGATDVQIASTEKWIAAQGKAFGVTDDELRPALAKLAVATGDVGKAQDLARLAMDVSAGSGKSLEQVTTALAKAQTQGVSSLSRLGVATKDAAGNTLTLAQVTDEMSKKYKGSAATAADTAAGKQKILTTQLGELQEQIGAQLLPVMNKLATAGLKMVTWVSKNQTTVAALVGTVTGLLVVLKTASVVMRSWETITAMATAAQTAYNTVMGLGNSVFVLRLRILAMDAAAWVKSTAAMIAQKTAQLAITAAQKAWLAVTKTATAVQWAFNVAMSANPIGLVIVAIVALVAALVIAYKKSETFRKIVDGAFHAVAAAAKWAFNWIKDHWKLILAILTGPVGIAVGLIIKYWGKIKSGAGKVLDWIKGHWKLLLAILTGPIGLAVFAIAKSWGKIKDGAAKVKEFITGKFGDLVGFIKGLPGRITSAASGLFHGITDAFRSALQGIVNLWNNLSFSLPGLSIKGHEVFGGATLNTPDIHLAKGGIVKARPGGIMANIGEGRYDEAVIPLKPGMNLGGGPTIIINGALDPIAVGKQVEQALIKYGRSTGRPLQVKTL